MVDITQQTWDTLFRYHRLLRACSEHGRARDTGDTGDVSVRLEEAVHKLLHGEALSAFILSQRPDLIQYAIENFFPHARMAEIMTHVVRRCGTLTSQL